MRILWYGDLKDGAFLAPDAELIPAQNLTLASPEVVVVDATFGGVAHVARQGLRWLQRLRRETMFAAPALIYSFERRAHLAAEFSMLAHNMPGIGFVRLPSGVEEFGLELDKLAPLTDEELRILIRWHSGLQEDWHKLAHDFESTLQSWPQDKSPASQLFEKFSTSVQAFARDQIPSLRSLEQTIASGSVDEVRTALQSLETGLCIRSSMSLALEEEAEKLMDAPHDHPPQGFESIAITDDQQYPISTINRLKDLGYEIGGPAKNLIEATHLLKYFRPKVVLADLNFPSRLNGERLLELARTAPSVRLIIAISRSVMASGVPPGVENCCGGDYFQNAGRIHKIIWRRARADEVGGNG